MRLLTNEEFTVLHPVTIVLHYGFRFVLFSLMHVNLITL